MGCDPKTREAEYDRLEQRHAAILQASTRLFTEQGYDRTTLGQIVEAAGGSLATVYKLFGNKEGLLDAVVKEKLRSGSETVRHIARRGRPPAETLRDIGISLHEQFLAPDHVAFARLVITRSVENAKFASQFFETTATSTRDALQELFAAWKEDGVGLHDSPAVLADIFFGLLIGDLQREAISQGAAKRTSAAELQRRIEFFLRGAGLSRR